MAPPKLVTRQQLEIMVDFMCENKDLLSRVPQTALVQEESQQKWASLAKQLNDVPGGTIRNPMLWKRYWIEWRYKVKKKDVQRFDSDKKCLVPMNDLDFRVLELCKPTSSFLNNLHNNKSDTTVQQKQKEKSDTEVLVPIIKSERTANSVVTEENTTSRPRISIGMEALETSINYWEDALAAFSMGARGGVTGTLALTSPEEAEFCREIQDLLQNAYLLQERCELLFLDQRSVLFRSESGGGVVGGELPHPGGRERLLSTHTGSSHTRRDHHSSAESFASAEDQVADLREFEDFTELVPDLDHLELYQMAMKQLEVGIPYRTLRTETLQCGSDAEFLCKLECVRTALPLVFRDAATWAWFVDTGRQLLTDLLLFDDKEPKEFLVAYEEMVSWTSDGANWPTIESELTSKGVKALTFYDVVLDFILLDAFEDLAAPPASVLAVVRNRWLSDRFKETALTTAVWSVIKAKRRYLKYPDGFMAHFYSISEHLLPVLVWGFLGPRERLREVCHAFQSEIVGFVTDIFSFEKCRYTTAEDLATDIMQHARARAVTITEKLTDRN